MSSLLRQAKKKTRLSGRVKVLCFGCFSATSDNAADIHRCSCLSVLLRLGCGLESSNQTGFFQRRIDASIRCSIASQAVS